MSNTAINWDLDSIFPGGSTSSEFAAFLDDLDSRLAEAQTAGLPPDLNETTQTAWIKLLLNYYNLSKRLTHANSFTSCLVSQNVNDENARLIQSRLREMGAKLETLWTYLDNLMAQQTDAAWKKLLTAKELKNLVFNLNEGRNLARHKMSTEKEALAGELAANGYHAWSQMYNTVVGFKEVEFAENGSSKKLSLGQLQNVLYSHPDRNVRQRAFITFEDAWRELAPTCAMALNNQAGFRLTLYRHRGWESILKEPLYRNRITQDTLNAMWDVIAAKSIKLVDYFNTKARLLGLKKLTWYDIGAPLGDLNRTFSFAEASDFVIQNIRAINPDIADFCQKSVDQHWIEAEDRSGKRTGAFCTRFPLQGETRIFMTFNGSYSNLSTLAHELGHGYHGWVLRDLPYGAQRYAMSVAETASTLNELIVVDASLDATQNDAERLGLLNQKLEDAAVFMMNIRARYEFERAFFEKRAKGQLSVEELSHLMLENQKITHHNALADDGYHPLFWASKLHFYITGMPFYNFPYTFGYLFSHGVYDIAKAEETAFTNRYIAMLRDTGSMSTEDLAHKHLGIDLTKPAFWENTIDNILAQIDDFVALADKVTA